MLSVKLSEMFITKEDQITLLGIIQPQNICYCVNILFSVLKHITAWIYHFNQNQSVGKYSQYLYLSLKVSTPYE